MRSRIVQCHGEAQRNSWGGVSEIVDREAGHSRRRAAAVGAAERSRCRRSQSWTTARRRRVPARAARALQASTAAVPENAVPTDGAAFAREAAIVPPEGADDLVSRAQWQWAIGESEAARGAEGASSSPAGDERATSPGTTKKRPTPRSRASPNAVAGDGKKRDGKKNGDEGAQTRPGASVATSKNTESRRAAETAIARVEMTEARAKLAVVERLLEDKPVRCADSEYIRAAGEKTAPTRSRAQATRRAVDRRGVHARVRGALSCGEVWLAAVRCFPLGVSG